MNIKLIHELRQNIKRISNEVSDIYYKEDIFKNRTLPLLNNADLHIKNTIISNHYSTVLSAIRRQVGHRNDEISLYNVLKALSDHNTEITEQWYADEWLRDSELLKSADDPGIKLFVKAIPHGEFQEHFGTNGILDKHIIENDIQLLYTKTDKIKKWVGKNIAHTGTDTEDNLTERDLYEAIETLNQLTKKYILLLTQVGIELKPAIQN